MCIRDRYVTVRTKIKVTCKIHGVKEMLPGSHFRRTGCRNCSNEMKSQRLTQDEFLKRCRDVHGNLYDYRLVRYKTSVDDVKIICRVHGVFLKHARNHMTGTGCDACHEATLVTEAQFLTRARDVHGDRYDYSLTKFERTYKKIDIICRKHGVFSQLANSHLEGKGCRRCVVLNGYKSRDFKRVCDKNNNGQGVLYVVECKGNNAVS